MFKLSTLGCGQTVLLVKLDHRVEAKIADKIIHIAPINFRI